MQIFLDYILELDYYLLALSDQEVEDFRINDGTCRARLFDAMKVDFDSFGPISKQRVLDAIEFILSSGDANRYWRYVVPPSVPLDDVSDKPNYLRTLYLKLAGWEPLRRSGVDVELADAIGPHGIDIRL